MITANKSTSLTETPRPQPALPSRWLAEVYLRYRWLVWQKLSRRDIAPWSAEAMQQEVFLTMGLLVQRRGPPESVPVMLLAIARNMLSNYLRRRRRLPPLDDEMVMDEVPLSQADVERQARGAEQGRIVEAILDQMPGAAAMLIRWIDLGEMTHEEVAAILMRPVETVRTQHRRARDRFRVMARRLYGEELG